MSVRILGLCPRDNCKGSIMADGTCFLCARAMDDPVAEPKPRHIPKVDPSLTQDWSVKCQYGEHKACGGRRLQDASRGRSIELVPCMCPHHRKEGA